MKKTRKKSTTAPPFFFCPPLTNNNNNKRICIHPLVGHSLNDKKTLFFYFSRRLTVFSF